MLSEFRKFEGWQVLEFFLSHFRSTSRSWCEGWGESREWRRGISRPYRGTDLEEGEDREPYGVFPEQRAAAGEGAEEGALPPQAQRAEVRQTFWRATGGQVSLAVFGSHAEGTQDEGSDVDSLVIKRGAPDERPFRKPEKHLGREVQLTWMEPAEWNERARKEDPLYLNVVGKAPPALRGGAGDRMNEKGLPVKGRASGATVRSTLTARQAHPRERREILAWSTSTLLSSSRASPCYTLQGRSSSGTGSRSHLCVVVYQKEKYGGVPG